MRMPHVVTYKDQIFCFNEIIVQKLMSISVRIAEIAKNLLFLFMMFFLQDGWLLLKALFSCNSYKEIQLTITSLQM